MSMNLHVVLYIYPSYRPYIVSHCHVHWNDNPKKAWGKDVNELHNIGPKIYSITGLYVAQCHVHWNATPPNVYCQEHFCDLTDLSAFWQCALTFFTITFTSQSILDRRHGSINEQETCIQCTWSLEGSNRGCALMTFRQGSWKRNTASEYQSYK